MKNPIHCQKCGAKLRVVKVSTWGAKQKVISYQCSKCDYFSFDPSTAKKVVDELKENALKIKQKVIKLSKDRLGIYLNKHIVESLNIQNGESVYLSVPEKRKVLLEFGK